MAATESLQFTSDPISLLSTNVLAGTYDGTLSVDYTTGAVTGSITTSPALGSNLPVLTYQNFTETFDSTTGLYTLSSKDGILGAGLTTFTITYSGMAPTSATSSLALVGAVPVFGSAVDADAVVTTPVCFASGTLIRTIRGEVPVDSLRVGDMVITSSGARRPIRWLGHRSIDCRTHPRSQQSHPVRVVAQAFGPDRPTRDLFLSPGHTVLVGADEDDEGGHLVPIMCLINGTTIERVAVDEVTYWHVELDEHDILLAEGLPAESYLDWGDRAFFTEGLDHALVNPDFVVPGLAGRCRPVAIDGSVVETERQRLDMVFAARLAASCAWPEEASLTFA